MRKATGISLILLIFLSLCLITFSLLSLSEASADERLSKKAADRTSQYYAAVSTANEVIAEIDQLLAENFAKAYQTSSASASSDSSVLQAWLEYNSQIPGQLPSESCSDLSDSITYIESETPSFQFSVSITETQKLHIIMQLVYPEKNSDKMYEITEWRIMNTQEWNADRSQNLLRLDSELFSAD